MIRQLISKEFLQCNESDLRFKRLFDWKNNKWLLSVKYSSIWKKKYMQQKMNPTLNNKYCNAMTTYPTVTYTNFQCIRYLQGYPRSTNSRRYRGYLLTIWVTVLNLLYTFTQNMSFVALCRWKTWNLGHNLGNSSHHWCIATLWPTLNTVVLTLF